MPPVSHATSEPREGGRWIVRFETHVPFAYEAVWPALTTADGLYGWLAAVDVLERRFGGAVTLRRPYTANTVSGKVTAWDTERVVEYTVTGEGRIRFHLDPVGTDSTVVRFLNERGGSDAERLDCLAAWHEHFEGLEAALGGQPVDWAGRTEARRAELRASYASFSRT
ncbi:SRPBCC domain-containing protein [Streptomyces sp. M-16]|uniref:SRPBCC domain-containing protein n=1 Tax=Streptomyces sp. M-16 TaxID=3233040 RepID=UPI003F99D73D